MKQNIKKIIIGIIIAIGAALGFIKYNESGEAVIVQDQEVAAQLEEQAKDLEQAQAVETTPEATE